MTELMRAEERPGKTKGELRKLRQQGKVPGVVYGRGITQPTPIAVEEKELLHLLRHHPNAVLELELPRSGRQPVMLSGVQRDPLTRSLLHIDFHQIDMNAEVRTQARLEPAGQAPGEKEGGIVQMMLHEIEIQCLPGNIPESIPVDISRLGMGENILVGDLSVPQGVIVKTDPELVVVTILVPQKDLTADEAHDAEVEAQEAEARADHARKAEVSTAT